ncbi:protein FD-like [Raphanus sativus]|uniref:LOW QUALITY PROTEIN: protein FD n=1 Tax=Raphanus sativus TaxID=3726 RepID=A0A9W3CJD5_RAPSA|nr:LOW QUALITY PROTEIN: protein FD [Raphanus sativus]XP_056857258.1 protein FD-like [Raphanus sativus]
MFTSAKHQRNHRVSAPNKNKTLNRVSSISSSSSPLHSQDSQSLKRSLVTMEKVWNDISLASIHHVNRHSQHQQHNHEPRFSTLNHQNKNPNSIFQDFLNRPLNQEPAIPTSLTMGSSSNGHSTTVTALFSSSPLAPPATVLSLNSGAGFEFLDNQNPLVTPNSNLHSYNHLTNVASLDTPFEALVTSTCNKRSQESNGGSGNRHHKRMIKNRESAARSRARKQAYTNELELKVAQLKAENARLKRQQDQLKMAAANQQPKKNTLQRSSTAPF